MKSTEHGLILFCPRRRNELRNEFDSHKAHNGLTVNINANFGYLNSIKYQMIHKMYSGQWE